MTDFETRDETQFYEKSTRVLMLSYDVYWLQKSLVDLFNPFVEKSGPWEFTFPDVPRKRMVTLVLRDAYEELDDQVHGNAEKREERPIPSPEEIAEVENGALEEIERQMAFDPGRPSIIDYEEVRLVGSFPRSHLVVLFRWAQYPDLRCGTTINIWNSEDWSYDRWSVKDALMFLRQGLENRNPDLPPLEPDPVTGIAWP